MKEWDKNGTFRQSGTSENQIEKNKEEEKKLIENIPNFKELYKTIREIKKTLGGVFYYTSERAITSIKMARDIHEQGDILLGGEVSNALFNNIPEDFGIKDKVRELLKKEEKNRKLIKNTINFDELYEVLEGMEKIEGNVSIYTSKQIINSIKAVRNIYKQKPFLLEGGVNDSYFKKIPESLGIRRKVIELLKKEEIKNKTITEVEKDKDLKTSIKIEESRNLIADAPTIGKLCEVIRQIGDSLIYDSERVIDLIQQIYNIHKQGDLLIGSEASNSCLNKIPKNLGIRDKFIELLNNKINH